MSDLHDQIAELEAQVEELSHAAERCARIIIAAKLAIVAAAVLLVAPIVGVIRFNPLLFVIAVSAALGGVALFGSTRSTRDEIVAAIKVREAERAAMIDGLELRKIP